MHFFLIINYLFLKQTAYGGHGNPLDPNAQKSPNVEKMQQGLGNVLLKWSLVCAELLASEQQKRLRPVNILDLVVRYKTKCKILKKYIISIQLMM